MCPASRPYRIRWTAARRELREVHWTIDSKVSWAGCAPWTAHTASARPDVTILGINRLA